MLSTHDIRMKIEEYKHCPSVAAERLYNAIALSLTTFNPVNQLPQVPSQVKAERDSLLFSQRALICKVEKLKRMNQTKLLTIKKLRAKLDEVSIALMNERIAK